MKLTRNKLIETLRRKNDGWTTYQARKIAGISIRRVNRVWNEYQESGEIPEIGRQNGRPTRQISEKKVRIFQDIHVSGHACREDHRELLNMLCPLHIIPTHGNCAMLEGLKSLALEMGFKEECVHILKNNQRLIV